MKKTSGGVQARINKTGYFFVLPFVLVYAIFQLWPIIYTFILSFSDLKGLRSTFNLVGFENFAKLVKDKYFWGSVQHNAVMHFWQLSQSALLYGASHSS